MANTKTCSSCKETQDLSNFYRRSKLNPHYQSQCKKCRGLKERGERDNNRTREGKRFGCKYKINQSKLKDDTLHAWYIAGLLAADGSIDEKNNRVRLTLKSDDIDTIEFYKSFFEYDGPLYFRNGGKYVGCEFVGVPDIVSILKDKYNVRHDKTFKLSSPTNIPSINHALSYIIGYIDGDGCIFDYDKNINSQQITVLGTENITNFILSVFSAYYDGDNTPRKIKTSSHLYQLTFGGDLRNCKYHFLTKKLLSIDVPKMKRKWDKLK